MIGFLVTVGFKPLDYPFGFGSAGEGRTEGTGDADQAEVGGGGGVEGIEPLHGPGGTEGLQTTFQFAPDRFDFQKLPGDFVLDLANPAALVE